MNHIQKKADQLIAPARAISKQIYDYQEQQKSQGKKNDIEFINSKYEELSYLLPAFKNQRNNFIDSEGRVKTAHLYQQIVPIAYAISATENYIEDENDIKLDIPVSWVTLEEVGKKDAELMYEELSVYTIDENGEAVYDDVDKPAVMVPKIQKIDTEKLSQDINNLINSKLISYKKTIDEQLKNQTSSTEPQGSLDSPKQDIKFEAAKLISDMLKNSGSLSVVSELTGETINLDLAGSLKLSSAKDRYSSLTHKLLSDLMEANGVVKIAKPKEVTVKLPNGEILKTVENKVEFGATAMVTDFFQTILTSQNVIDKDGKNVPLFDRWLSIAAEEYNKKIDSWLKENSTYIDSVENNSKFFNFFASNLDEAQKQIHSTYFPNTNPAELGIKTIDNPFEVTAVQYDNINQYNPMSTQYQQIDNNNQIPNPNLLSQPSNPPIGGLDLHNNQTVKTQPQGGAMTADDLLKLL